MRSQHKRVFVTLSFIAIPTLACAGEKSFLQPWPYGLYDESIKQVMERLNESGK